MKRYITILILLLIIYYLLKSDDSDTPNVAKVLPVVMWHGMGDTCCLPFSLGAIKKLIERETNGTYVKSLQIGGSFIEDYRSGFFIHPDIQIDDACQQISKDSNLKNGFNALGFSQGGQFLRALLQRCPWAKIHTLITFGGQHQGIFGLPKCPTLNHSACEYIRTKLTTAAYEEWVQRDLVQATYWHDPTREEEYRARSTFLSDINNERLRNKNYIYNLQQLQKFVMVKFNNDTVVTPKESQWFGYYATGQDKNTLPLRKTKLYLNDDLGLKKMDADKKLIFLATDGDHLQFSTEWFIKQIIPYLLEV